MVNASCLKLICLLKVTRDLLVGSGRCESTRQSYENNVLFLAESGNVHLLRWETIVNLDIGNRISDLNPGC